MAKAKAKRRAHKRWSRLEVHVARDRSWYWLLRAPNGQVTASHETHPTGRAARIAADKVQASLGGPEFERPGAEDHWDTILPRGSRGLNTRRLRWWRYA